MYVHTRVVSSFHHKLKLTVEKAIYQFYFYMQSTCKLHANGGQNVAVLYLCRFDRIRGEGLGGWSWSSHQQLQLVPVL